MPLRTSILCFGVTAAPTLAQFTPEHFYAPADGGLIVQWDRNLDEVGQIQVDGVDTATGAVFNADGHLVFIARKDNTVRLLEVDADGTIVNEYDTGNGSLNRGSYIAYHAELGLYAFANDDRVTVVDADLEFVGSTADVFDRASGVAFGPGPTIWATDQFTGILSIFDLDLQLQDSIFVGGWINVGIDRSADGDVLVTSFGDGDVFRYDFMTEVATPVVTGFGFGDISDVLELPSGDLAVMGVAGPLYLFDADGVLLDQTNGLPDFGDGVAYLQAGCAADINGDGMLDILDFVAFQSAFLANDPIADCDANGVFDVLDFVCFQNLFSQGC